MSNARTYGDTLREGRVRTHGAAWSDRPTPKAHPKPSTSAAAMAHHAAIKKKSRPSLVRRPSASAFRNSAFETFVKYRKSYLRARRHSLSIGMSVCRCCWLLVGDRQRREHLPRAGERTHKDILHHRLHRAKLSVNEDRHVVPIAVRVIPERGTKQQCNDSGAHPVR